MADLFLGRPRSRRYPKFNIRRDIPFVSAATDTVRLHWLEKVILNLGVIAGILGMVRLMGLQEGTVLERFRGPSLRHATLGSE